MQSGTSTGTSTSTNHCDLVGSELVVGKTVIGRVEGVVVDPVSGRPRRLIARYGQAGGRRVAVPMEWVGRRGPGRVELGINPRSLEDLPDDGGPITYPLTAGDGGHSAGHG